MILTLRLLGREVLTLTVGAPPHQPPPEIPPHPPADCDRPHRDGPGFGAGSAVRLDMGPRRWPEVSA